MKELTQPLLESITSHRLPGIDLETGAVYPFYDGLSIANLPASVCTWLGARPLGRPFQETLLHSVSRRFKHVVLVLVDGLGLRFFRDFLNSGGGGHIADVGELWNGLLDEATLAPLTSVAPSTTSAALTSLWTGLTPAGHGVAGYEMWLKEYGILANLILHAPTSFQGESGILTRAGFHPDQFLKVPMLGSHLAANGITPRAFLPVSLVRSTLSQMLTGDAEVHPYRTMGDLWVSLRHTFDRQDGPPSYTYVYWSDLDTLGHLYGPDDERIWMEFASFATHFAWFVRELQRKQRGDVLILLSADHGQMLTPKSAHFELKNHPAMTDCLVMSPSGETRLAYLYLRPGREKQLRDYIEATWPGSFKLTPSGDALAAGLFGPDKVHPRLADRIGDLTAVSQGKAYWWWANKENHLLGRHGGLSAEEMLVPLVMFQA